MRQSRRLGEEGKMFFMFQFIHFQPIHSELCGISWFTVELRMRRSNLKLY